MNQAATAATAHADQLAAHLRDARCCDAFAPCRSCASGRRAVATLRHLVSVPPAPVVAIPQQRGGERGVRGWARLWA